jgi:hypothetical protein
VIEDEVLPTQEVEISRETMELVLKEFIEHLNTG